MLQVSGPKNKQVKMADAPQAVWGAESIDSPCVGRAAFSTGVLKALAGGDDKILLALGDPTQQINNFFDAALIKQGLLPDNPDAKVTTALHGVRASNMQRPTGAYSHQGCTPLLLLLSPPPMVRANGTC